VLVLWLVSAGLVTQTPLERILTPGASPKTSPRDSLSRKDDVAQGKLYFSDMWFKNRRRVTGPDSPARSG